MNDQILLDILKTTGKVDLPGGVADASLDLFDHGLTSFNSVQVMLAIEERFGVFFPDELMRRETFQSLASLRGALDGMLRKTA